MGSKKRGSDVVEEVDEQVDISPDDVSAPENPKKKIKKDKKKKEEGDKGNDESSAAPSTSSVSIKPMERRKKRKALDKEKHSSLASDGPKPSTKLVEDSGKVQGVESSSGGGLPEFHIGVFKDLGSADVGVREAAAEKLVVDLREVQRVYDELDEKGVVEGGVKMEAEKDDGLNNCAPSVRYAVRRLIRGVSSSRECARQGFALGLTLLVGAVPAITIESLLKLIVDLLEVPSSMKGQEIKDCLLGRLFAYGAVVRSGRLIRESMSSNTSQHIKEFTDAVVALASRKRYLQEPAVLIILELAEKLPVDVVLNEVLTAPGLCSWFEGAAEAGNPDALLLALKLREKIYVDNQVFGKLLPYPYSSILLFSSDHLSSLANCLKESTFCQPRVHSIWPVLTNIILPDTVSQDVDSSSGVNHLKKPKKNRKSEEDVEKKLRCFWDIIIEGSLLLSSHDRKHLAFHVFLLLLPRLPSSCIPVVLSYKLVQCLMDILSTKDSWLYKSAQNFLKELSDWVKYDDEKRVAVIVSLQKHSNGKFDCITHTKLVKDLVAGFKTESGYMLFIQNLTNMFLDDGRASEEPSDQSQTTDENSEVGSIEDKELTVGTSDFLKTWVVDSLPGIMKHINLDNEAKFRVQKEILKFLAVQGLFCSSLGTEVTSFELQEKFKWPKATISSALCRTCIEQLQLLLANAQKGEGPHAMASGLEANDLGSYFMRFLSTLKSIPSVSLFRSLSEDDEEAFKRLQAMETRLFREERNSGLGKDTYRLHALRYLLIQLLLQILYAPGEFSEAASELVICCKKCYPAADLDSPGEDDEEDNETIPELMDVLVDTLLSLLPQSSAPMRSAIEQVFKYFSDEVTDVALLRMLRIIKKDLKASRHQGADDEDDDDDGDEDDLLDIKEEEELDESETGETGESDMQTDGSDSEAVVGAETIGNEVPEGSDDSDSGMDDEAMFRMDSYIAQIFKEKKNQTGVETAHSQLVLFKLRVLSLLEIFLHENQGDPQVVKIFSNLAQAYINLHTTKGSDQLGQRIWGILQKKILKAKVYPKGTNARLPELELLLEKNLKLASKPFKRKKSEANLINKKDSVSFTRYKMITSLAQSSTLWILKIIDGSKYPETNLQRVFGILEDNLTAYLDSKKSQLKPEFLKEVFRRWPWIGRRFFGFLLEKCGNAKLEFRQVEGLDLVKEILNLTTSDSEEEKKMVKSHLSKLCGLVKELATNMPEKQSRRAEVRRFCGKVFNKLSNLGLNKTFLEKLDPATQTACENHLGKPFLDLKQQDG